MSGCILCRLRNRQNFSPSGSRSLAGLNFFSDLRLLKGISGQRYCPSPSGTKTKTLQQGSISFRTVALSTGYGSRWQSNQGFPCRDCLRSRRTVCHRHCLSRVRRDLSRHGDSHHDNRVSGGNRQRQTFSQTDTGTSNQPAHNAPHRMGAKRSRSNPGTSAATG